MRFATILFGVLAMAAVGCGGNPEGGGEESAAQVQSTLEATGKVEFYVDVKGHNGAFEGETTVKGHAGQMPAFRFHTLISSTPSTVGTGLQVGKPTNDVVTITKEFGAADPQFQTAVELNEVLPKVGLHFFSKAADGTSKESQTVTLTNARVVKFERSTIALDDTAKTQMFADEISFSYESLELKAGANSSTITQNPRN